VASGTQPLSDERVVTAAKANEFVWWVLLVVAFVLALQAIFMVWGAVADRKDAHSA
jgi:hypothetical protein